MDLKTPVLFIIFNRLATTKRVFGAIRQAKPERLFIAADGPRHRCSGEEQKVRAVRDYVLGHIDWECQVKTLFSDKNLGCQKGPVTAIDWFFENESEGIILEDDCVPDPSFFRYAEEMLDRYRDDERVMVISGQHFQGPAPPPPHGYYFSRYLFFWGWASWRRAWRLYDRDVSLWPALRDTDWLLAVGHGSEAFQQYWTKIFDTAHAGNVDFWDYQWLFSCWAQSGLGILPARNLVTNVGFGEDATHTFDPGNACANLPLDRLEFPLSHPLIMVQNFAVDRWADRYVFGIEPTPLYKKVGRLIPGAKWFVANLRNVSRKFK